MSHDNIGLYSVNFFFLGFFFTLTAQEFNSDHPADFKKRHAIYGYPKNGLTNTDSIPDFASKVNPLKITGTVFLNDGIIPAKDVMLFITQADENGNYELKTQFKKRYVHHRGWIKTNADGQYTCYTFVPGTDRDSKALKSIHLAVKESHGVEYSGHDFLF